MQTEKEKYAASLESRNNSIQAQYGGGGGTSLAMAGIRSLDVSNKFVPLGKYVSQMEMLQPNARNHLKEMLEQQMRDKQEADINASPHNTRARVRMIRD